MILLSFGEHRTVQQPAVHERKSFISLNVVGITILQRTINTEEQSVHGMCTMGSIVDYTLEFYIRKHTNINVPRIASMRSRRIW